MVPAEGEDHPERFELFGTNMRDHFSWKFLVTANLFDKIAALVITEVNASN